jgi:hypothetical protein
MQQYYPVQQTMEVAEEPVAIEEANKVEDIKSSPDTKDTEVKKAPVEEAANENEANGLDFDEME